MTISISGLYSVKFDFVSLAISLIFHFCECEIFFAQPLAWCSALFCQTPSIFIVNILSVYSLHCFWSWSEVIPTNFICPRLLHLASRAQPMFILSQHGFCVGFYSTWISSIVCNSSFFCLSSPEIFSKKVIIWSVSPMSQEWEWRRHTPCIFRRYKSYFIAKLHVFIRTWLVPNNTTCHPIG